MKNSDIAQSKLGIGTNRCQCGACGRYFTTVANFDAHRRGSGKERRCEDPLSMLDKNGNVRFRLTPQGLVASSREFRRERSAQS